MTAPLTTPPTPDLAAIVDLPLSGTAFDVQDGPEAETPTAEESIAEAWSVVTPASDRGKAAAVRVLLVEELDRVARHIAELIAPDERVRLVETVSDGRVAVERITAERPDVVIIDALLQGELSGAEVARRMRAAGAEMPIVFLTVPDKPLTVGSELGAAEVLSLPIEGHTLLTTITDAAERLRQQDASATPAGTVAVFSAKGGVGRTAIAHNLAVAMGQIAGTRVVLMDGDQVHGDLRLHLEAPEEAPSLLQLPTGHVSEADVAPLLWQDATGLDVLLAPPRMEQADLIMTADVRRAHATLKQMSDLVVIDVPATMDDRTLAMLDDADVVIDVTTPRRGAVCKMQRCHAVLTAAGFPMDKILTVVNHADADYDPTEFEAELGWAPDAVLMHDERLASGKVAAGSSIVTAYPDALFSRGFNELASLLRTRMTARPEQLTARAA
jgi:pilus assembly protein CpaE